MNRKHANIIGYVLFGAIFFSLILSPIGNKQSQNVIELSRPNASAYLTIDHVTTNISAGIYRGQTMNIVLDARSASYDWNDYDCMVNFSLQTGVKYSVVLERAQAGVDIFNCNWTPSLNDPVGEFTARILISKKAPLYDPVEDLTLTRNLLNNKPRAAISMNNTEVKRNSNMTFEISPSDIETPVFDLTWKVELVNYENTWLETLIPQSYGVFSGSYSVPASLSVGLYFIKSTCYDPDEPTGNEVKYPISILNQDPVIIEAAVNQTSVFRGNYSFTVSVNATDKDLPENLRMKLTTRDSKGENLFLSGYDSIVGSVGEKVVFTKDCTLPYSTGIGKMLIMVEIFDNMEKTSYDNYTLEILVKNNAPQFTNFTINNQTDGGDLSFVGNTELVLGFIANDPENTLKYAKVQFVSEANTTYANYNYTFDMTGSQANFSIYTKDIPAGQYVVYAWVIDADGAETKSETTFNLVIEVDTVGNNLPWVMLIIGLLSGLVVMAFAAGIRNKKEQTRIVKDTRFTTKADQPERQLTASQKRKMREMRKIGKIRDERSVEEEDQDIPEDEDDSDEEVEEPEESAPKTTAKFKRRM